MLASRRMESAGMFALAIVGGGINGAGIARDAAGRGLRVLLVEQNDLASGTSSASTKLIHGGLRYLEHGWLRLVRQALRQRGGMLRMAPHPIRPLRFVLDMRGRRDVASARVLVNATGPWLKLFATSVLGDGVLLPTRLDKGSHIVVPRLFDHDRAYIVQTRDRRVVFALPFEGDFTL